MNILYMLASLLALLVLQSVLLRRYGLRRVRYSRAFSKPAAFAGETVMMTETLRNEKLLPVPFLMAESRMSPHLYMESDKRQEALQGGGEEVYHRSVFFLTPFVQVTRRHRVGLLKRGYYRVGSVTMTAGDLFGLSSNTRQLDTGAAITVYPALLPQEAMDIPSSRWQGDLVVKRWIAPDPFLVAGIREWQPGDAKRDVHWGATARTGRLQVKAHDHTADPKLLVILNVQKDERQWGDSMAYEQAPLERGISLAATLCLRALSAGVEAGFAANAPLQEEGGCTALLPGRYAGRDLDILEALARLRILRAKNFHTFLEDLGELTGMDIVILTLYDSALIQERMRALRLRGNSVALWLLAEGEPG